jgi:signal transduction histidine kinase
MLLATASWRQDYATGYTTARIALAAGEAGDHGVETARTRHVFSLFCLHWFEPLEQGLLQARRAHQELRRCGEQEFACYTFYSSQAALLDCGASLHDLAEENSRALAFARRSGNRHAQPAYAAYSALIAALTGVEEAGASPDEPEAAERLEQANPMAACYVHLCRALAACLLHDNPALQRHAEAASRLELYITGFYPAALIRLLQAFALIRQHGDQLESCQSDHLDQLQAWFVARAADAPQNFAHLADLIAAERLRASGQTHDALPLYERAMRTAIAHQRPWHAALAAECAARCYLALGLEQAGLHLMEQAHQRYGDWGAGRVTTALEQEFPVLRGNKLLANDVHRLLGASQSLARLRTLPALAQATAQLVGDLSGATDVQIVGLDGEQTWKLLAGFSPQGELRRQNLEQAERRGLLPASALRLSLQQLQPLVCHDAVLDPRFTADSHLDDLSCCSLLVVPVVVQQRPIAAVIAMYRLKRGAFGPDLARSVELLCGHLAVALENLLIQQSLEQQVQERSQALVQAYDREARREQQRRQQLEQKLKTSLTAAAVVHEVQQPLAAILLNCRLALQSLEALPAGAIPPALARQLRQLTVDGDQVTTTMERMRMLLRNVETEHSSVDLAASLHNALLFLQPELQQHGVSLSREGLAQPCPLQGDAAQLQIAVMNLLRNAIQAMATQPSSNRQLAVHLQRQAQCIFIRIADSGPGFADDFSGDTSWEVLKSSKATGMGIGLFLAQTAASNHHGQLRIGRSAELGGAEVVIELPQQPNTSG